MDRLPHIVGLDTSLTSTGIATAGLTMRARTAGLTGATKLPPAERTAAIVGLGHEIMEAYLLSGEAWEAHGDRWPDLVVLEAPDASRGYGGLVERLQLIHEVQRTLVKQGVPFATVTSGALKGYATDNGGVDKKKARVIAAVERLWPEYGKVNGDKADAAVLAAMGLDWLTGVRRVPDGQSLDWLWRGSAQWPAGVRWAA